MKIFWLGYLLKILFFSFNLFVDYEWTVNKLNNTDYNHYYGDIVTFDNKLTAIGGCSGCNYNSINATGRKVEVYNKPNWNDTIIPSVGNYDAYIFTSFSTLSINKTLFVFGMNY